MRQLIICQLCYPFLGLLSRANPHLQLSALVILLKIRYDSGFSLGAFTKNKCIFCYPLLGLLSGVNDRLTIDCIGYSVLGEH